MNWKRELRQVMWPTTAGLLTALAASPAAAQVRLDRADPSITEQALPRPALQADPAAAPEPAASPPAATVIGTAAVPRIASAIVVDGNIDIPTGAFASALVDYLGRDLSRDDLARLAGAVAGVARQAGYPFASATVERQSMADGVLHVTLDEGRITAVRVVGATNALADRMLSDAFATGRPVRRETLERVILLVGDIAGVTVKDSRYVRQDGFGILLVTIATDRVSAYAQVDNRGSAEVGPIRSTVLASVRGVIRPGDEVGIVAASTPLQPREFAFARVGYRTPVDLSGSILTVSGSYGRANPGAALKQLDVVGNSVDAAVAYQRPLLRSRERSLWAAVELRTLKSDQTLLGARLRDDRLTTLAASLNGVARAGPGTLRGELTMVAGLPLAGVTHQGDARASRVDGDARFVTWGYSVDWTTRPIGPFAMALASAGQLASRPLLATAEIGAGGPAFGRGYDYAERTGDQGVLGSAELRADLGGVGDILSRLQLYGFVDGGYVDNLRDGLGGGSLLSTGTGARIGRGLLDGMIEVAFPLNADRIDTGTKQPRVSFRVSRSF